MLKNAIITFRNTINYSYDSYLIMSAETKDALISECNCEDYVCCTYNKNYYEFCNIPIAICDKLTFGEVEIK